MVIVLASDSDGGTWCSGDGGDGVGRAHTVIVMVGDDDSDDC